MAKWIAIAAIVGAVVLYPAWKPSAAGIADDMIVTKDLEIIHDGKSFESEWGEPETVEGYLRRKDRHYEDHIPILTYDPIITSGEFSDPDVVEIDALGNGNYYLRSQKKPTGDLVAYHTVPVDAEVQAKLDDMIEATSISLVGRLSENSEIKSDNGAFSKLGHKNHKFILVEDVP